MRFFALLLLFCALFTAVSNAQQFPGVTTEKSVWPDEIFLAGTGVPDEAEVTLTVNGIGDSFPGAPIDLIFAIDASASMAGIPLTDAKAVASGICGYMEYFEQSGLVGFNDNATLLRGLSFDHVGLISVIYQLTADGYTALGDAINLAQEELASPRHKQENLKIILVISDGSWNRGSNPFAAAQNAKASGTLIYALGIGDPVEETILRGVVSEPQELTYWHYPSPLMAEAILAAMRSLHTHLAARSVSTIEVLDSRLNYVPGSFSWGPDTTYGRFARWSVGDLGLGQSWNVSFLVTASDTGLIPVENLPTSRANYKNYAGGWVDVPFPQEYIRVRAGVGIGEGAFPERDEASVFSLIPNPFHESCRITYSADGRSPVRVTIHDLAGRLARTLAAGVPAAGSHDVYWLGDNDEGHQLSSGAYICRFESGGTTISEVILLVR